MKRKIDLASLGLGILLAVSVTGVYDAIVNAMMGRNLEMLASIVASVITGIPLFIFMAVLGFFKREE